jgi:tRNA dimethylallyltransferase
MSRPANAAGAAVSQSLPAGVVVVIGPTAAGKTELAAAVAAALDGEIVGADSRQVYRWMDAGTAKPSRELRSAIPHHLIDVVDPDEGFDVAAWRSLALRALAEIHARGRHAIVCGGTGLYVRSLVRGLFRGPAADPGLRASFDAEQSSAALHDRLREVDPVAAARIHPNDRLRIVRALEVFTLTGRPISDWHREHALAERRFETLVLRVEVERAELARRIETRSRAIVEAGIVEELATLRERYGRHTTAFDAIGYREAGACLDEALAPKDLAPAIARATRAYAKRQLTWDRSQSDAVAIATGDVHAAVEQAAGFFEAVAKAPSIG